MTIYKLSLPFLLLHRLLNWEGLGPVNVVYLVTAWIRVRIVVTSLFEDNSFARLWQFNKSEDESTEAETNCRSKKSPNLKRHYD